MSETHLDVRGFPEKNAESRALLESAGGSFLTGFGFAAEAGSVAQIERDLAKVDRPLQGFAYEGAGMAYGIRDGLPVGHRHHITDFLAGEAKPHTYMVYVGVGWALARVPRFCWPAVTSGVTDPLARWLVHDGYGFHQAYFQTDKYVCGQFREEDFGWPAEGPKWYSARAIDQGIGRAMWFVAGTDVALVSNLIHKFDAQRRPDLFAGVGLAATYAGGAGEAELRELAERAGVCRPQLAQGSAFAASARVTADLVTPHTELASRILCGVTPQQADHICQETKPDEPDGDIPAFEVWRRRIAEELLAAARSQR
nr:UnbL [Kibdelosporangium sp. MJ126-NF4]CTQ88578.1 UnbL [Kibdelosporangium sp. MJ126-NF4]